VSGETIMSAMPPWADLYVPMRGRSRACVCLSLFTYHVTLRQHPPSPQNNTIRYSNSPYIGEKKTKKAISKLEDIKYRVLPIVPELTIV
jgi:hypothetical protein